MTVGEQDFKDEQGILSSFDSRFRRPVRSSRDETSRHAPDQTKNACPVFGWRGAPLHLKHRRVQQVGNGAIPLSQRHRGGEIGM